jgi:hypothetical protein
LIASHKAVAGLEASAGSGSDPKFSGGVVFASPGRRPVKIILRYIAKQRVALRSRGIREKRNETNLVNM